MAKRFFETFPALILEDELKDLFEFAEVTALKYIVTGRRFMSICFVAV